MLFPGEFVAVQSEVLLISTIRSRPLDKPTTKTPLSHPRGLTLPGLTHWSTATVRGLCQSSKVVDSQ
jgi:hypothetical protein